MGVNEIQSDINNLNSQVRNLGISKTNYQNMNKKITQAINELSVSYNYIKDAKVKLVENYTSETSRKKEGELEEQANNIDNIIRKLRDEILTESNRQITTMESQMQQKQQEILRKEQELQEEKNQE